MACDLCLDRMNEKPMYRYAGVSVYLDSAARALRVVVSVKEGEPMIREVPITYCPRCGHMLALRDNPRKEFIPVKGYVTAKKRAPWAERVAVVDGGFLAFESLAEYLSWRAKGRGFDRRDYE